MFQDESCETQGAPSNNEQIDDLVDDIVIASPGSIRSKEARSTYEEFVGNLDDNAEEVRGYLDFVEPKMQKKQEFVAEKGIGSRFIMARYVAGQKSAQIGSLYKSLGHHYVKTDKNKKNEAIVLFLRAVAHLKFANEYDPANFKTLLALIDAVVSYYNTEDFERIPDDSLLINLKKAVQDHIAQFGDKKELFDHLSQINILLAQYFTLLSKQKVKDIKDFEYPTDIYLVHLFEEAISFSRKGSEDEYENAVLQYIQYLSQRGRHFEADRIFKELSQGHSIRISVETRVNSVLIQDRPNE